MKYLLLDQESLLNPSDIFLHKNGLFCLAVCREDELSDNFLHHIYMVDDTKREPVINSWYIGICASEKFHSKPFKYVSSHGDGLINVEVDNKIVTTTKSLFNDSPLIIGSTNKLVNYNSLLDDEEFKNKFINYVNDKGVTPKVSINDFCKIGDSDIKSGVTNFTDLKISKLLKIIGYHEKSPYYYIKWIKWNTTKDMIKKIPYEIAKNINHSNSYMSIDDIISYRESDINSYHIFDIMMWIATKYKFVLNINVVGDDKDYPKFTYEIIDLNNVKSPMYNALAVLDKSYDDIIKNSYSDINDAYNKGIEDIIINKIIC